MQFMQTQPTQSIRPLNQQTKRWITGGALIASAIFLFLQTFTLPNVPRIANGDQGIYLTLAARMLDGQVMYRDFDHFTLPGTSVLYLVLFKLFGVRAWIAPAMLIIVGVSSAWLIIRLSENVMSGAIVFLPALLFLTLPFAGFLDATHHWYSILAGTAALLVVIKKRTDARVAWSGLLWGIATCFTQTAVVGAMGTAIFLIWEHYRITQRVRLLLRKEGYFIGSLLATVLAFNAYFIWKVGLKQFLNATVVFTIKYYPADSFNQWRVYMADPPSIHVYSQWPNVAAFLLVHLVVPLVYILVFVRYWRESGFRPEEPWDRLLLLSLTGVCLFLGAIHSAGSTRMYTISVPALILLAWFLKAQFKTEQVLLQGLWAMTFVLAVARPVIAQTRWNEFLDLPTGRTAFSDVPVLYYKCKWVSERTHPGDYFLNDPQICFALRLRDPSRVPFLRPTDYTRPEEVRDAVQALARLHVRFVGWSVDWGTEIADSAGNHLAPLRVYLREHFHVAQRFSNGDEIWERND
jgi:hypothetical protein